MSTHRYRWAREIFFDLMELPAPDRESALREFCGSDHELCRDVEELLAASETAEGFLDAPILGDALHQISSSPADPEDLLGERVGVYVLERLIGSGGMGGVYLGRRDDDEFHKLVAIKILHADLATKELLGRFQHERQILSDMEHPNIARLYDGGVTDDGRPYIVMEYVEGLPIDTHCEQQQLDQNARIELFREACRAVQHAHRNLVVHRDLKPSNILVDARGRVKLLDFGISEVLDSGESRDRVSDPMTLRPFTPRYSSPEQASFAPVTTAADVYSLGVVLRKILTGEADGDLSTLSQDLRAIIERAVQIDPELRYSSVENLSEDLRRHRVDLPLTAVPASAGYLARKFLRRNRIGVAWAICFLLLMVVATAVSLRFAIQANEQHALAEERFDDVHELATTFLYEIYDAVDTQGPTAAREKMVSTALDYLDALNTREHGDPALARDIARGYFRIASLQGDPSVSSLGDPDAGRESSLRGVAIVNDLLSRIVPDDDLLLLEAEAQLTQGNISRHFDDLQTSRAHYDSALVLREKLDTDPLQVPRRYIIHKSFARTLERAAAFDEAIDHYEAARSELEELVRVYPEDRDLSTALISTRVDLGQVYRYTGQAEKALSVLEAQVPLLEAEIQARPEGQFQRAMLGGARLNLGRALDQLGMRDRAGAELEAALPIWTDLIRTDPRNVTLQLNASSTHHFLGRLRGAEGDHEAALAHFEEMLAIRRRVAAGKPESLAYQREVATALDMTGSALRHLGRTDEALPLHQEANRLFLGIATERPDDAEAGRAVAVSYYFLGKLHAGLADEVDATASTKHTELVAALDCYRKSRTMMVDLKTAGLLAVRDEGVIDMLDGEIAKCDQRLSDN